MVNAQQYIESSFPKHIYRIFAIGKNLEGHLDLSEYPNLVEVRLGNNPLLTSLSLGPSPRPYLTAIGFRGSGITNFSFLANLPNIHMLVLVNHTQEHQAKIVRDINQVHQCKDQEIEKIKQQIIQLQQQIQSLKTCENSNRNQNSPPNLSSERNNDTS
ncbi:3516_t:CDS:1 [Dentiscutata erythropus]|uniref:3516_t:CDS:1 n=1 Tax=Dentiscutata erythropus TaxID=1348616 RepID=A0A9N9EM08_9GLOM|nr:3516_t:CDS:1 [Dentiscutata erythropus]